MVTGVEDLLQEDVPRTLEDLRRGGVRIWMLTGDQGVLAVRRSWG